MKKVFLTCLTIMAVITGHAQNGSITSEMLGQIKKSYSATTTDKALINAISNTDIRTLAVNRDTQGELDTYFSNRVPTVGITNQKSSGRCWLFTGLNVLRSRLIASKKLDGFEFSQSYCFFWDQLEKSNLFLQSVIDNSKKSMDDKTVEWLFKNPIGDGGTYTGVADLVAKYGLVPKSVMPESFNSDNTSHYADLMSLKLREFGLELRDMSSKGKSAKDMEIRKTAMLGTVYRMLVLFFGEPVNEFQYAFRDKTGKPVTELKKYTPKSFYEEEVKSGIDLNNDFVMLMNDPSRPYWQVYDIDLDRHLYEGHNWLYVNLPIEEIKSMAIQSIKNNEVMYFSCDVGKFQDKERGLLDVNYYDYEDLLGTKFSMDKKQRIQTFSSGSSHAMTLTGVDLDSNGVSKKWLVENSWGKNKGYDGFLIMTDKWFDEYMFRLVVNKKYISTKVLDVLKKKPVKLPVWDPMFSEED